MIGKPDNFPILIKLLPMEGAGHPAQPYQVISAPEKLPSGISFKVLQLNFDKTGYLGD